MKAGDKVKLRDDVLQRHARSVPAHMGYTTAQFNYRDTLRSLQGLIGIIERTFPGSAHVNVMFGAVCIGIDCAELEAVHA